MLGRERPVDNFTVNFADNTEAEVMGDRAEFQSRFVANMVMQNAE